MLPRNMGVRRQMPRPQRAVMLWRVNMAVMVLGVVILMYMGTTVL